jgi:cell division protein FtsQ
VTVVERTPVAVVADGSGWAYIDASGVAYARAPAPSGRRGLPVVRTRRGDGGALTSAAAVLAALPKGLRDRVATVDARSEDSVVLRWRGKGSVVWGSPERSADKARVLAVLMKAEKKASVYDVSAPDAPTVR